MRGKVRIQMVSRNIPENDRLPVSYFWNSTSLALFWLEDDQTVVEANAGAVDVSGGDPVGGSLAELLTEHQSHRFGELLAEMLADGSEPLALHFDRGEAGIDTLLTRAVRHGGAVLLIGERPCEESAQAQETIARLNAEISALARQNAKQSARLQGALTELENAQAMLVHQETVAALGRTTAGVAHELNNPLAYAVNNQHLLQERFEDLLGLVNALGDAFDVLEEADPELFDRVMDHCERIDLPAAVEEVPELLDGTLDGLHRAKAIVESMRVYARLDESAVKEVDLNRSLESAADFAAPLAAEAGVELAAEWGDIPPVTCDPGPLNQAVTNLLVNAIQASQRGQRIVLSTRALGDDVEIAVADEGPGVPEDLVTRIFEPFFTTRDVGAGAGLGLSIAAGIVERHEGDVFVDGAYDSGARFVVRLPVAGPSGAQPDAAGADAMKSRERG